MQQARIADIGFRDLIWRLWRFACQGGSRRTMNTPSSKSRHRWAVGGLTPSDRAGSAAFQIGPWSWASIVQKRRTMAAGPLAPIWSKSRSTKIWMKFLRPARLSVSGAARKERGKPPRNQCSATAATPSSARLKPPMIIVSSRPASDSDQRRTSSGEALPKIKNRAGNGGRPESTRKMGKSSGRRSISSMTTRPLKSRQAVMGSSSRSRLTGPSRSNQLSASGVTNSRASVVLPQRRGPMRATTGAVLTRCGWSSECRFF